MRGKFKFLHTNAVRSFFQLRELTWRLRKVSVPAHQCSYAVRFFIFSSPLVAKKIARPKFFARASGEAVRSTLVKKFFRACLQSSATRGAENKKSKRILISKILVFFCNLVTPFIKFGIKISPNFLEK